MKVHEVTDGLAVANRRETYKRAFHEPVGPVFDQRVALRAVKAARTLRSSRPRRSA